MEFRIDAFVGPLPVFRDWRRHLPSVLIIILKDDLGLVPLTDGLRQDLRRHLKAETQTEREIVQLWGAAASQGTTLAFITADYYVNFLDDGVQNAFVWTDQQVVHSDVSINDALRALGVQAEPGNDEFDTVDLGRCPDTDTWAAAAILEAAVSRGGGAVAKLIQALSYRESPSLQNAVRREAAKALGQRGPAAKEAIPALAESVKTDSNLYVREAAARALGQIGGDAVPALIQLLKTHPDELARGEAAKALGEMGKDARAAAPALLEALREPAYLVRLITARAVGKVYVADKQLREAFEALAQSATRDPRREVRISAVRTLATIGPEAVPTLIQVLKKESEWIARADAAEGLAAYGHAAGETVPALVAALRDPQVPVRIRAVEALGRIGGGDEETVKALEGMSEDDDEYVRKTAREVLRKIQAGKPWG